MEEIAILRTKMCDDFGKFFTDYTPKDLYLKIQEKMFNLVEEQAFNYGIKDCFSVADQLIDIAVICISYLKSMGYDEETLNKIFSRINDKKMSNFIYEN